MIFRRINFSDDKEESMKEKELPENMQEHDLVAIENDDKKVHLVRLDEQSQRVPGMTQTPIFWLRGCK